MSVFRVEKTRDYTVMSSTHLKDQNDVLLERGFVSVEQLDGAVDLMAEVLCSRQASMTIAGAECPIQAVRDRFLRLDSSHIEYVFDCLKNTTTRVRNIKKYLLTALFNAPTTIDSYYAALVNHDLYSGKSPGG